MEKASLPVEKPSEPKEGARQPMSPIPVGNSTMTPIVRKKAMQNITFAESGTAENYGSQTSSNYKEALSQPAHGLTHSETMLWLQERRSVGLWAQCDDCDKWRYLPDVLDPQMLPNKWFCRLNPDKSMAECSIPETPLTLKDEEDLIHNEYTAGSVVWARLFGWPWWPAMVTDDPDTEQYYWLDGFSDIPTFYNVVFFDEHEVTRAWISLGNLKPYLRHRNTFGNLPNVNKYKTRLTTAITHADDAAQMAQPQRLAKYSFVAKYKGPIRTPKKIDEKILAKIQTKLQKQYNIDIPMDLTDSNERNEDDERQRAIKRQNVILVGTPKNKRAKKEELAVKSSAVAEERAPKKLTARRQTHVAAPKSSITKNKNHASNKPKTLSKIKKEYIDRFGESVHHPVSTDISQATPSEQNIPSKELFKEPNSMAAQPGSLDNSLLVKNSLNCTTESQDTCKLVTPNSQSDSATVMDTNDDPDFDIRRAPSPSSDDFEF